MLALVWMGLGRTTINLRITMFRTRVVEQYRYINPHHVPVYKFEIELMTVLCLVNYLYQFPLNERGNTNYHILFLGPGP
jgi:hypothetical protein